MDLFDELGEKKAINKAESVRASGGDLLDELNPSPPQKPPFDSQGFKEEYFRDLNESLSVPEKLAVGFQRGLRRVGRGITGDQEHPDVKQAGEMLNDSSPSAMIGDVAGAAAPFVPLAMTGGGMSLLPRVATSGAIGAGEGALISRGSGESGTDQLESAGVGAAIAGGMEALFPVIGRLGRNLYARLGKTPKGALLDSAGKPTQEFSEALKDSGITFDELTQEAIDLTAKQKPGASPTDTARLARFESHGIPATTGDITQDFAQQSKESRLSSMASGQSGEPLRQLRLRQSEAFKGKVDELVSDLGVPDRAGTAIKSALEGRSKLLRKQKNSLYKKAAETSKEVANVPIFSDAIAEALPDKATMRRLGRLEGGQINALTDLLVEFGVDNSDEAVEAFTAGGGEIIPLTLGNLEDFRGAINQIMRADKSGAATVAAKPVLDALDGEADEIASALDAAGVTVGDELLSVLKEARQTTRQLKTEFSPESITGRLTGVKRDGVTPIVEASRVFREMETKPNEQVSRVMSSLFQSGKEGRQAIGDIKASVFMNALDAGLKAPSRKTDGIERIGGNQFAKYLDKIGEDKLKTIFKGDEANLRKLMSLKQVALDMNATADAMPKGSAPVILDLMNRMGRLPVVAAAVDTVKFVASAGADDRAVRKALQANPKHQRVVNQIERELPALSSALGISIYAAPEGEE